MKLRSLAGYAALLLGGSVVQAQDVTLGKPIVRAARPDAAQAATPINAGGYGVAQTVLLDPTTESNPLKSSRLIVVQRAPSPAPITPPPMPTTSGLPRTGNIRPVSATGAQLPADAPKSADTFAPVPKMMPLGPSDHTINTVPMPGTGHTGPIVHDSGSVIDSNCGVLGGDCFGGCNTACCKPTPHCWGSVEYLLVWTKSMTTPALLTTSPPGTPFGLAGRLDQTGTRVLEGNDGLSVGGTSGIRATIGGWFAQSNDLFGFEASGFVLEKNSNITTYTSDGVGNPILARPFFNAIGAVEGALVFAHPAAPGGLGAFVGTYDQNYSQHIWGAEGNFLTNIGELAYSKNYLLVGFRYFDLHDKLTIATTSFAPSVGIGTQVVDVFNDRTQFYGGQLGLRKNIEITDCLSLDVTGKIAMGVSALTAGAAGVTRNYNAAGAFLEAPGGLYAVRTNSGRFSRNQFAVLPEADVKINYRVSQNLFVFVGGNFTYISNVVRPGDQMDRRIDLRNVPVANPALVAAPGATQQPAPRIVDTDFWLSGITAGVTLKY